MRALSISIAELSLFNRLQRLFHRASLLAAAQERAAPERAGRAGADCPARSRASEKSRD
jgi:hypothetical protein